MIRVRRYIRRRQFKEELSFRASMFQPTGIEIKDIYLDGTNIGTYKIVRGPFGVAEIYSIFIKEPYQKRGLGKRVVQHILKQLKDERLEVVRLTSARDAVGFWERMGFYIIDEDIDNEIRMEKVL